MWHKLEVASHLPSSLHPSDYKHGTQNVPMPLLVYLCCKITAVELCWNGTFSMFLETAYGLVIIIELQVCIDKSVLAIPMNLCPQRSCAVPVVPGVYDAR